MRRVFVNGQGIAAITTAWELAGRGFSVNVTGHRPSRSLPLVLEEHTVELIENTYGIRLTNGLQSQPISRRVIRGWGSSESVVKTRSLGVTLDSLTDVLRARLQSRFARSVSWSEPIPESESCSDFRIEASGRNQRGLSFGNRAATMATVKIQHSLNACVLERTDFGWAFLVPHCDQHGTLFGFAADSESDPTEILDSTVFNHFRPERIRLRDQAKPWRACSPQLNRPLVTQSNLLVGESAFTLDPICGDGVGYAARSALLAATAVVDRFKADFRGLRYYSARLHRTFLAHLVGCANMYSDWIGSGWKRERELTQKGIMYLNDQYNFLLDASNKSNSKSKAI